MMLDDKIRYSINLLQKHEQTALKMNPEGYYVAFSGGKDSQVIYELCKMAGVKFKAHFNCTTVDPKEVLRFIHEKYPDVIWHRPEKSMFKLIEEQGSLPLRNLRYCCRLIKEYAGVNSVVVMGLRKSESRARQNRKEVAMQCVKGEDKIMLCPILEWTTKDVWQFIKTHIGYNCILYDMGFRRIGCVACPNAYYKTKLKELLVSPKFEYAYKKAIQKCIDKGNYEQFDDADDVFKWWIGGKSIKQYLADKTQYKLNYD
jgi:phosphoadenosine phosphosulfate reductase